MINIQKQIDYWKNLAEEDIETAEILLNKNKYRECLFFCHLTLEKILKAHYCKAQNYFAPKTHHLKYLLDKTELEKNDELIDFLSFINTYNMEGRYPENFRMLPSKDNTHKFFNQTKEILLWLIQQL